MKTEILSRTGFKVLIGFSIDDILGRQDPAVMLQNAMHFFARAQNAQVKAQNYAKAAKRALSKMEAHLTRGSQTLQVFGIKQK